MSFVRFQQDPTRVFAVSSSEASPFYTGDTDDWFYDVAFLRLVDPVPAAVVANVAPVYFGDISEALRAPAGSSGKRLHSEPALITGYGRNTDCFADVWGCALDPNGGGTRRKGWISGAAPAGKGIRDSDVRESSEAAVNLGDSGGPIFFRDPRDRRYYVVGVAALLEYRETNSNGNGNELRAWWATTGSVKSGSKLFNANADWLVRNLGGDLDRDGVPDDIDNCAPSRCVARGLSAEDCANPDQEDADGDMVGDACDLCAPAVCDKMASGPGAAFAKRFTCINPDDPITGDQPDMDGDGIGDQCDLCPRMPTGRTQHLDSDGDLVGDDCEVCADSPARSFAGCYADSMCPGSENVEPKCIIISQPGESLVGRCANLADSDEDGVGDSCDNCTSVSNELQVNSNWLPEADLLQGSDKPLGDACDPVPLFRIADQVSDDDDVFVTPEQRLPPDGKFDPDTANAATVTMIRASSWFADAGQRDDDFDDEIAFRYCGCYDEFDVPLSEEECVAKNACPGSDAYKGVGSWRPIDVHHWVGGSTFDLVPGDSGGAPQPFNKGAAGPEEEFAWEWYRLTKATRDNPDPITSHDVDGLDGIRGLVASAVLNHERDLSDLDMTYEGRLRSATRLYDLPWFEYHDPFVPTAGPTLRCVFFGCHYWLKWWEAVMIDYRGRYEPLSKLTPIDNQFVLRFRPGGDRLATQKVHGILPALLTDKADGWAYLAATEPGALLAARGVPSHSLLVPRTGNSAALPLVVHQDKEGNLTVSDQQLIDLPAGASELAAVQLPDRAVAVFSALEQALFVVGGERDGDANLIRRFDLAAGDWQAIGTDSFAPSTDVRGAAYDPARRTLFVLDIEDGKARIVAHSFGEGGSRLLWSAPFVSKDAYLGLGRAGDGSLMLLRAKSDSFKVWRGSFAKGGELKLERSFKAVGTVIDQPIAGHTELMLPVVEGELEYLVPLREQLFVEPEPCLEL